MATRFGGSFAPPLNDDLVANYKAMAEALPADSQIRDAMLKLHTCCAQWWELPESTGGGKPHASGRGTIIGLDEPIKKALWEAIPWRTELDAMAKLFDGIDAIKQKPLRDAAHHLLWHANELDLDREPITSALL